MLGVIHKNLDDQRKKATNYSVIRQQEIQILNKLYNAFIKGKFALFIGICGGQASGKKKISEYFFKHIKKSDTICEMSFFKSGEKERKLSSP